MSDSIGIDVSKVHLDAHRLSDGAAARFENTAADFRQLLAGLPADGIDRIVYEPTGQYHMDLERAVRVRLPLVRVNPLQACR